MSAKNKSGRTFRLSKSAKAKQRMDAAAFMKFVKLCTRRIVGGDPLVMVVTVVDTKYSNHGLTTKMIKGPPPPPPPQGMIKEPPGCSV